MASLGKSINSTSSWKELHRVVNGEVEGRVTGVVFVDVSVDS